MHSDISKFAEEAANNWKIDKLCQDLSSAKKRCNESDKKQNLSQKESDCLYALLCQVETQKIAKIFNLKIEGLNVDLSRGLYKYIKELAKFEYQREIERLQPTQIPRLLEDFGYKRNAPPTGREVRVAGRLWIDQDHLDSINLEVIVELLRQIPGNIALRIDRTEPGSVVIVFKTSQAGFKQIQALFRSGELTELLGVQVLDVQLAPEPVNLSQWLQDVFEEGWQTVEEIFGPRQLAFRSAVVKRAKQIDLGGDSQVALLVDLPRGADEEIDILLRVYPAAPKGDRATSRTELPENLNFSLLYESEPGKIEKQEVEVDRGKDCIEQELTIIPGEWFSVKLTLGDVSVTQDFSFR